MARAPCHDVASPRRHPSAGRSGTVMASTSTGNGTFVAGLGRRRRRVGHVRLGAAGPAWAPSRSRPTAVARRAISAREVERAGGPVRGSGVALARGQRLRGRVGEVDANVLPAKQLPSAARSGCRLPRPRSARPEPLTTLPTTRFCMASHSTRLEGGGVGHGGRVVAHVRARRVPGGRVGHAVVGACSSGNGHEADPDPFVVVDEVALDGVAVAARPRGCRCPWRAARRRWPACRAACCRGRCCRRSCCRGPGSRARTTRCWARCRPG